MIAERDLKSTKRKSKRADRMSKKAETSKPVVKKKVVKKKATASAGTRKNSAAK